MKHPLALALLTGLAAAAPARAAEQILSFHSDIAVQKDGSMTVRETIRVRAEGNQIKRGIYRDFPTDYKDRLGQRYRVGFEVTGVARDGAHEDWHIERRSNGYRVYIGHKDRMLRSGEYRYTLGYRTNRQLGFFPDHDELYWNVTGNDWAFPILESGATVRLPGAVPAANVRIEAYTGRTGSREQAWRGAATAGGAEFGATRRLNPGEGLTIVVGWPKGWVREPTTGDRLGWLLSDNPGLTWGGGGIGVLLAFYGLLWARVGRDPQKGVIVPEYFPPKGYSPASARFISRMGYDNKAFAAALINLAVKGHLILKQSGAGTYSVERRDNPKAAAIAPGEAALMKKLFAGASTLEMDKANHANVRAAIDAHKQALRRDYEVRYFATNRGWYTLGILLTIAVVLAAAFAGAGVEQAAPILFLTVWLSVWTPVTYLLGKTAWQARRTSLSQFGGALAGALAFGFFEVVALGFYVALSSIGFAALLFGAVALNVVFSELLKAPTLAGRRVLDKLEGFKQYLEVAEKDELEFKHAPAKTPDLFEMYLPYALALDVENRWAERFAGMFARMKEQGREYHPGWYRGTHWDYASPANFSSAVGDSLSSAISSASTPPGSSGSGFSGGGGGGGSSGGGGGGGGGGGW